jgi:hypothetical protein
LIEAQKSIYEENGELLEYSVTMIKLSALRDVERNERYVGIQIRYGGRGA